MALKILVVDDDEAIANLLAERLQEHGYEVVIAHDSLQAVMSAHRELPDLILLDIMLPGGGGIQAYGNLRSSEHTKDIPLMFITAYDTEEIRQKVIAMGAKDFIAKPFKMEDILSKIENALKK